MQQLAPYVISAPGFMGLNTTDAPTDLQSGYALTATNCVIDKYGRIGARKGWEKLHSANADLGVNAIETIGEHTANDGTSTVLAAGNNKLFKLSGSSLVTLSYGGGGVAPTITANKWQTVSLDGYFLLFQEGHDPLAYVPTTSTTQYYRVSELSGYLGTIQQSNCAISAFGRVWNASTTTDKVTVQWSDTKSPHKYSGGTSGTLDLTSVWPTGGDSIVGLAAHNNRLFIFGKQHILIYMDASTPATMSLEDAISGIGAVGRDTIVETGSDVIFLSNSGVRSVMRTIQEKSAPLRDISRNVRTEVLQYLEAETSSPFAVWNDKEAFYLLHFPTNSYTFCFDTRQSLQDGSARATTWTNINPKAMFTKLDGTLLLGQAGYIASYSSYLDDTTSYRLYYYTSYTDFGNPISISMIKKIAIVFVGGSGQNVAIKWAYDYNGTYNSQSTISSVASSVAQYGVGEYGVDEYSNGLVINTLAVNSTGSGKIAQIGVETDVTGENLSIQKIEVYAKNGRLG